VNRKRRKSGGAGRVRLRRRHKLIAFAGLGLAVAAGIALYVVFGAGGSAPATPHIAAARPAFVGSKTCGGCHAAEYHEWLGSHHQLAMQPATAGTVLGDFDRAKFRSDDGVTTKFFRDGDQFMVRTDGPDGKLHDYPVKYTFGVYPLQQYLIPLSRGRLQAFTVAWDSRPAKEGGQRWFALYPGSGSEPKSALHWTAPDQTWNYSCADCHSTDLRKHYNPKTRTYKTAWAEVSVGCEACHGPGSNHVAWAKKPKGHPELAANEGLAVTFDGDKKAGWTHDPKTGLVRRSRPRTSEREIQTCAGCHSLRTQIHEDTVHGQPLGDNYRVELLTPQYYFPDGQIKGEVYEYGSFIQSRMFHAGVTCTDCHNPHTATLRAKGNRLCTSCHLPAKYDTARHTHHPAGSAGAQCVACHMPTRTYMRIDRRRDHSIRVPRPDLSVALGTPNACNACHNDKSSQWAAREIKKWFGPKRIGFQGFARTLEAGRSGAPSAHKLLAKLVNNHDQPAIARATALQLLARGHDLQSTEIIRRASQDPSALVRRATAARPSDKDLKIHLRAIARLLDDPVRVVRIAAADSLAGVNRAALPPATASALKSASAQYVRAGLLNADRPEAHLNLASFYTRQKAFGRAEDELNTALSIDPSFAPASVNLADLYRALGRDAEAGAVLHRALRRSPDDSDLLFSIGLLEVRQGKKAAALVSLAAAAHNAPENPRYAYVYAIALNDAGKTNTAIAVLARSLEHNPYHRASLAAIVSLYEQIGNSAQARKYHRRLERLPRR
jgi:predicted CXXCH cytochrome family protein